MTDFVLVQHPDAPDGAKPGKVPARALDHWKAKGFLEVGADGLPIVDDAPVVEDVAADPAVGEPFTDAEIATLGGGTPSSEAPDAVPDQDPPSEVARPTPEPGEGTDDTAVDPSADTTSTSGPKTTGRAGRVR